MSEPLYKLVDQLQHLVELEEELDAQTFADTMEGLQGQIEDKCTNVCFVLKDMKSDIDLIDIELKRLTERKRKTEASHKRLKGYLQGYMQTADIKKVPHPIAPLSTRKGVLKLVEKDGATPPPQFTEEVLTIKVDRRGLLAAIKDGAEFDGYTAERGDDSLIVG